MSLAAAKGDIGWHAIVSFTNNGGFAETVKFGPIVWQDDTETYMGDGTGFQDCLNGGVPAWKLEPQPH